MVGVLFIVVVPMISSEWAMLRAHAVGRRMAVCLAAYLTGIGWLAGIGTAVTLFLGLPEMTLSE